MAANMKIILLLAICGLLVLNCDAVKPGRCQRVRPGQVGICVSQCRVDENCAGRMKCCGNGCGTVCRNPV
ncbi:hypothetical protein R5R35_012381 [Gryllus longicercus]|uniref:WAP domain-containing protein n=1 Tax=Gryllus longicercus TaxID=2509291 RepID=A0AAN9VR42_9ORTH